MKKLEGSLSQDNQLYTYPLQSINLVISADDLQKDLEILLNIPIILNRYNYSIQLSKPEKLAFTNEEVTWMDQYLHRTLHDSQYPTTRSLILDGDDTVAEAYVDYLYREDIDFSNESEQLNPLFQKNK